MSEYFQGVGGKRLSAVEADGKVSHQHEFNGASPFKKLFGTPTGGRLFETTFLYLADDDDSPVVDDGRLRWYDSREKADNNRTEWRLYYTPNRVMDIAEAGDGLIIAQLKTDAILAIVTQEGSTIDAQLRWLFGIEETGRFEATTHFENDELAYTSRIILQQIGIEPEVKADENLEEMEEKFGTSFPSTATFSEYARSTVIDLYPGDDGDTAIVKWMDREDLLFRAFESHLIHKRIMQGFNSTDDFIQFSLSVQNRRKSRAGLALENHLSYLFQHRGIRFSHTPTTELKKKPDFIFPDIACYRDNGFNSSLLTMLGAKTTLKDRWRQVLTEAERIHNKHLITLQPSISENQTDEMKNEHLALVVPKKIHLTFTPHQQSWLMSVEDLIEHLYMNQRASERYGNHLRETRGRDSRRPR